MFNKHSSLKIVLCLLFCSDLLLLNSCKKVESSESNTNFAILNTEKLSSSLLSVINNNGGKLSIYLSSMYFHK